MSRWAYCETWLRLWWKRRKQWWQDRQDDKIIDEWFWVSNKAAMA